MEPGAVKPYEGAGRFQQAKYSVLFLKEYTASSICVVLKVMLLAYHPFWSKCTIKQIFGQLCLQEWYPIHL